jgi:thiamine biosynthesis lipoprotein
MHSAYRKYWVLFWGCLSVAVAALQPVRAEWYSDTRDKMGTRVQVQLWTDNAAVADALLAAAMQEFDRVEQGMSTYISDSEVSRINSLAHRAPLIVSSELFDLIEQSLELSSLTNGAFDITYDSVGKLYDFRSGARPTDAEISSQLPTVGYRLIQTNADNQSVFLQRPGVRINLGGIAKGHAVERVIALLAEQGVKHALATAGGDTRLLGGKLDQPWMIGIRDPNDREAIFTRLALSDEAISTSGDYERFFIEDGERYHHILNPSDGKPVRIVRSVTVIGPDAMMTDGLSTSVFVMGPENGMALINSLDSYEAVVITDSELYYSAGLKPGGVDVAQTATD